MWRSILAVLLMTSLAVAQGDVVANPRPEPFTTANADSVAPGYRAYTYFDGIRQGTTQKAVLMVTLGNGYVASPKPQGGGVIPIGLEMTDSDGLHASDFEFPRSSRRRFAFQKNDVDVVSSNFFVQFKLRAAGDAAVGEHTFHGKMLFQRIGEDGVSSPQEMQIELRVKTVPRNGLIVPTQGPPLNATGIQPVATRANHDNIWLIALAPIMIPLSFLMYLVCGVTGQDCSC